MKMMMRGTKTKKIIVGALLALAFVGGNLLFAKKASAAATGQCVITPGDKLPGLTKEQCVAEANKPENDAKGVQWWPDDNSGHIIIKYANSPDPIEGGGVQDGTQTPAPDNRSEFEKMVSAAACLNLAEGFDMAGCLSKLAYYGFFQVAAFTLWLAGRLFNFLISIAFDSSMFTDSEFIPTAWGVVRDLSNIFFILILLYTAFQIILGIGGHGHGHGPKKMIAMVVIMALLINFSMFFTGIVIDSSNILANVFYNKIIVTHKDANGNLREYPDPVANNEKDASGGIVGYFNPTKLLTADFLNSVSQTTVGSVRVTQESGVSSGIILGIVLVSAGIMFFAAYAFFSAGFAFLGRLLELWVLIIASPFAFMSFAFPSLAHIPDWGWSAWLKRLITSAFMAPAFMFFLYLIFLLINSSLFKGVAQQGSDQNLAGKLILFMLPALIVMTLLMKSVKLAKMSSGHFADTAINLGKAGLGLAIGGAALGAAAAGRATLGAAAKYAVNEKTRDRALKFKDVGEAAKKDWYKPWKYPSLVAKTAVAPVKFTAALAGAGMAKLGAAKADKHYGEKTHATHLLDAKMQQEYGHEYGKDAKFKDLATEKEINTVKKELDKDEIAKFRYGKLFKDVGTAEARVVMQDYDRGARIVEDEHTGKKAEARVDNNGNILSATDSTGAAVPVAGKKVMSDLIVEHSKANAAMGEFIQALRKGSYDIRNLPDMSAKTKGIPKLAVGLTAMVAAGVRLGLKKGVGVEYGTPQKDILKDIGNVISESLKTIKVNVNVSGGHGGGDHGGGHHEVKSVGH